MIEFLFSVHIGNTALIWAVKTRSTKSLQLLLDHKANPNTCQGKTGKTPLQIAMVTEDENMINMLLVYGAKPKGIAFPYSSSELILWAMKGNFTSSLEKLVEQIPLSLDGPLVPGKTILHCAVEQNSLDSVYTLSLLGMNFNHKNKYGETTINFCAKTGNKLFLQALVELGANLDIPDYLGNTPIMNAVKNGHLECVEILAKSGVDLDHQNCNRENAVFLAILKGQIKIFQILIANGVQVNLKPPDRPAGQNEVWCSNLIASLIEEKTSHFEVNGTMAKRLQCLTCQVTTMNRIRSVLETFMKSDCPLIMCVAFLKNLEKTDSKWRDLLPIMRNYHVGATGSGYGNMTEHGQRLGIFLRDIVCDDSHDQDIEKSLNLATSKQKGSLVFLKLFLDIVKPASSNVKKAISMAVENHNSVALEILLKHLLPNYCPKSPHNALPIVAYHALSLAAFNADLKSLDVLLRYKPNLNAMFLSHRVATPGELTSIIPEAITYKPDTSTCVNKLLLNGASARWPDTVDRIDQLKTAFTPGHIKMLHAAGARPQQLPDHTDLPGREDLKSGVQHTRTFHTLVVPMQILMPPVYPTGMDKIDAKSKLTFQCREFIRNHLVNAHKENLFFTVPRLPLPQLMKSFLLFNVELKPCDVNLIGDSGDSDSDED